MESENVSKEPENCHLVIADIIIAFIDTFTIFSVSQYLSDVFDVWNAVYDGIQWPANASMRNRLKVD